MSAFSNSVYTLPKFFQGKFIPEVCIFLLSILIYTNTLTHEFTQDDAIVIYDNIYVKKGWSGIVEIFGNDSFSGFFQGQDKSMLVSGGRYRPLTIAFFAIIYEVVNDAPFLYHLINIVFYGLLCLLIYKCILQARTRWKTEKLGFFAFIAAIVFAVHPIHTEVVANVKGLDEIFSLIFSLLALSVGFKYNKSGKMIWMVMMALFFAMALLSKEGAIAFLIIIPVTLYYFTRKKSRRSTLLSLASLSIVFVIYWVIRTNIVGSHFGTLSTEMMNNPFIKLHNGAYVAFDANEKWSSIVYGLGKYIQLLVFPHPLTHDYYPRHFPVMTVTDPSVIVSLIMNGALVVIGILGMRKRSLITYCIFFFYCTIGLTSNVLFPIGTHLSERFLFTPSLSVALLLALFIVQSRPKESYRKISSTIFLIIVVLAGFKTITRSQVWKNDYTLFTNDVRISKNSAKVRNAAGGALLTRSINTEDANQKNILINEAILHLKEATRIHPNYKEAHLLMGNGYSYLKSYDESINSYENALRVNPNYNEAGNNLLITLQNAAREAGEIHKNYRNAISYLEKALTLDSKNFQTISLLGTAHGSDGNHRKAIQYFEQAIEINPNIANTYINLGLAQLNMGLEDDAQINFQIAAEIDPNSIKRLQGGN